MEIDRAEAHAASARSYARTQYFLTSLRDVVAETAPGKGGLGRKTSRFPSQEKGHGTTEGSQDHPPEAR